MSDNNFYHMEHATVVDTGTNYQIIQQFVAGQTCNIAQEKLEFVVSKTRSIGDVVADIRGFLDEARSVMPDTTTTVITGKHGTNDVLVILSNQDHRGEFEEVHDLSAVIVGFPSAVDELSLRIKKAFSNQKLAKVRWWFEGRHGNDARTIYLPPPKTMIYPEFYPDLGDPVKFMEEYLASDASVLLLAGEAGTGKTTLLRHMIVEKKLTAHVIYEEKIMEKDAAFQSFLFDEEGDIMVIEDADTILSSREADGNKMMARFLSVSDGLVKLPNKKLVFTTNLSDFAKVDEALLRPGRCFATIKTRKLNLTEAQAAAKVAGLPIPIEKGEYTLAELFNQGYRPTVRRAGFGVRH